MLIGITGAARHGKDSAANALVAKYGFVKLGFADAVREMALAIDPYVSTGQNRHFTEGDTSFARYTDVLRAVGYETAKSYDDVRRLLQRIGTEGGRAVLGDDVWVDAMVRKLGALSSGLPISENIVICDVRFENEASLIKQFGGYLIRVTRPNFDNGLPPLHASETAVATLPVDYDIETESFEELQGATLDAFLLFQHIEQKNCDKSMDEPAVLGAGIGLPSALPTKPSAPRIYLAAPWVHKDKAAQAKQRFIDASIEVVSGWTERENSPQEIDPARMQAQAMLDRDEVGTANTLVILGSAKSEGKASEMGMALAQGKRVILVKEDRVGNIFYHLPEVERVDTLDEAIALLGGMVRDYRKNTTAPEVHTVTIHSVENIAENGVEPRKLGVITE